MAVERKLIPTAQLATIINGRNGIQIEKKKKVVSPEQKEKEDAFARKFGLIGLAGFVFYGWRSGFFNQHFPSLDETLATSSSATGEVNPNHHLQAHKTHRFTINTPVATIGSYAEATVTVLPTPEPTEGKPQASFLPPVGPKGDEERRALAANENFAIDSDPSISVAIVRSELKKFNSPLLTANWADGKDAAEYIWDAGRMLHIDPAVLLAIFWHESNYGTVGVARLTFSVGNIRPLSGQPELNGYRFYRTWQESVDDTYRLLRHYARGGLGDISSALPVWAPSGDNNDVGAYVNDVQTVMARYYAMSIGIATKQ